MNGSNKFEYTAKLKNRFLGMLVIGVVLVVVGMLTGASMDRFWSNYLHNTLFFLGISVLAVFFLAAHQIGMAGWHITVKRIPEAMSQFSKVGAVLMLVVVFGVIFDYHHLYHHWTNTFIQEKEVSVEALKDYEAELAEEGHSTEHAVDYNRTWQDFQYHQVAPAPEHVDAAKPEPEVLENGMVVNPYYDRLIDHKSAYLNKTFWSIRSISYLFLWVLMAMIIRRYSLREDLDNSDTFYQKTRKAAAVFLIIWAVSSSTMTWDWVMALDPHWYSTLFGWYNFISLFVASICTTILILIYLKRNGYLTQLNENHLHDLGKYAFGFSVFWTYLWFSQFMLYWYGNIPEETRWCLDRARTDYKWLFYANLLLNFLFPFLTLMRRDAKRNMNVLMIVAIGLIITHWLDFYMMITPATLGTEVHFGILEIGMFIAYAGIFLFVVFGELAKASLIPQNHPMYKESLDHHI